MADAKVYEIEKAKENLTVYLSLKRLELENAKTAKWNGEFPKFYLGGGNNDHRPGLLLNVPALETTTVK